MITLISTPEYAEPTDPTVISRWLATESPNNFRLLRRDWIAGTPVNNGGFLQVTVDAIYTGSVTDVISIYDLYNDSMLTGTITNVDGTFLILTTDIPYVATMNPAYLNDHTLYGGYYFEGRMTINDVLYPLTIIASPDSFGYADLDVSGILRIHTSLGKTGNYTELIMQEPTKSGNFSFEYRECWYGSDESWIPEGGSISPPSDDILWYYAECVRSEEQGSNLHEYVVTDIYDAPFLNLFDQPVYFRGLPFDLSFILPEFWDVSPNYELIVTIKIYNSANTQLGPDIVTYVDVDALEGFVNSLNIHEATVPEGADYMTAEIEI